MTADTPNSQVQRLAMRPQEFVARLRMLAADTRNVKWSDHARDRMTERGIPIRVALTVIREGIVAGQIEAGKMQGEWKAKVVRTVKGRRDVGVVVLLVRQGRILVKTVEWEDVR